MATFKVFSEQIFFNVSFHLIFSYKEGACIVEVIAAKNTVLLLSY